MESRGFVELYLPQQVKHMYDCFSVW